MQVSPSAKSSDTLRAVALGLRLVDKDTKRAISASIRTHVSPMWVQAVTARLSTKMDRLLYAKGARVAPGNPARAMAGTSRRALPGGGTPVELVRAWEFGAPTRASHEETYNRRSPGGAAHQVTRHTKRQVPAATRTGRVAYPAFADMGPRLVSLWVQIIVRTIHESLERR